VPEAGGCFDRDQIVGGPFATMEPDLVSCRGCSHIISGFAILLKSCSKALYTWKHLFYSGKFRGQAYRVSLCHYRYVFTASPQTLIIAWNLASGTPRISATALLARSSPLSSKLLSGRYTVSVAEQNDQTTTPPGTAGLLTWRSGFAQI